MIKHRASNRIKHQDHTPLYKELRKASEDAGDKNFCSVTALAAVTGRPVEQVRSVLEDLGRKPGKGAYTGTILRALEELGGEVLRRCIPPEEFINKYPQSHRVLKNVTTHHPARFPKAWQDGRRYLIFTAGHVVGVVNGEVHDWSSNRALRATSIYEVYMP